MLSIVIPTLDDEPELAVTLAALVPAAAAGVVGQVVVADGGSRDGTAALADAFGCDIVTAPPGRGGQLVAGAAAARHDWLLFLHADTVLEEGWHHEAAAFSEQAGRLETPNRAAAFRFALDDQGLRPRLLESLVALRCALFALPYGDQGLLIARTRSTSSISGSGR